MMNATSPASPAITVVDGSSLFDAIETFHNLYARERITLNYGALNALLQKLRTTAGWRPASNSTITISTDPSSEGQARFVQMLTKSGFEVDACHFRFAFTSLPAGQAVTDQRRAWVSFSARLSYVAGLVARYDAPQILFLSHSFELYGPLTDLAARVGSRGRVGLAFFKSLLDYRWDQNGFFQGKSAVQFFDLGPYEEELFGLSVGGWSTRGVPEGRSGLAKF